MELNAGELDKRITILRRGESRNEAGYPVPEPAEPVRRCWAKFTRLSGTEAQKAGADFGEVRARFVVRSSRTALDRKMLVEHGGGIWEIEYVNDYGGQGEYTELQCRWRGTGGESSMRRHGDV